MFFCLISALIFNYITIRGPDSRIRISSPSWRHSGIQGIFRFVREAWFLYIIESFLVFLNVKIWSTKYSVVLILFCSSFELNHNRVRINGIWRTAGVQSRYYKSNITHSICVTFPYNRHRNTRLNQRYVRQAQVEFNSSIISTYLVTTIMSSVTKEINSRKHV